LIKLPIFLLLLNFILIGDLYSTGYLYKNKMGEYSYQKLKSKAGISYVEPVGEINFFGPLEKNSGVLKVIEAAAKKYRVDSALIKAIIKAESNFKSNAISPAGAEGIMQMMPGTAIKFGVINTFNYRESIFGGTRYLRHLLNNFMGNIQLAIAAYNAGETAVFKYGTIPPFEETQQYVKKVISFYNVYMYRKFKDLHRRRALKRDLLRAKNRAFSKNKIKIAKRTTRRKIASGRFASHIRAGNKWNKQPEKVRDRGGEFFYQSTNVSRIKPEKR